MTEKKQGAPRVGAFRFLSQNEFAKLSTDERIKYLEQALEAIKTGHPLDDLPVKDGH